MSSAEFSTFRVREDIIAISVITMKALMAKFGRRWLRKPGRDRPTCMFNRVYDRYLCYFTHRQTQEF